MTSTIKVNNIQNQCGANIINESSNTITLGASGDTIALASGASQTGFGRTGTVDWETTKKTGTFTATSGEGYFCDTSSGSFTVNLPAGSAGAIVSLSDYTRTFHTNNLSVAPNGSEKIGGVAANAVLEIEGQTATFIYVDSTEGWINTQQASGTLTGATFITASVSGSGNTLTTSGNYKIATFTGPGTFTVCSVGNAAGSNSVDYLVVAGGGGGGGGSPSWGSAGGGGAGGYRESSGSVSGCYTIGLPANSCVPAITVTATGYPITVGGGGAGSAPPGAANRGTPGVNSTFSSITSAGGGGGGSQNGGVQMGINGGSGGGGAQADDPSPCGGYSCGQTGATGNIPSVSPPQGNDGGDGALSPPGAAHGGGGGGGAGADGGTSVNPGATGGAGGTGATSSINGTPTARGGGGGGAGATTGGAGGTGGGGAGSGGGSGKAAGTANTGGGGGGGGDGANEGEAGGSGIVIIRYRFQ
jgi:hypothetical protein